MPLERGFRALALCDRAHAFLASRGPVGEDVLLAYVYGGAPPVALRGRLAEPLLGDPRLERRADGYWAIVAQRPPPHGQNLAQLAFTTLALVATGPSPDRGRVVQLAALHMHHGRTVERFNSTVNPGKRVPRYLADRIGIAPELLDDLPPFASTFDDLVRFLAARPVVAQDARLTWGFVEAEARRLGQALAEQVLIDANELATHLLDLSGKPTLARVAGHLDIGMHRLPRPDEEARVLGLVTWRLLSIAAEHGVPGLGAVFEARASDARAPLRRSTTAESLADLPGIYVMRDLDQTALYVGKARRLRSRMAAYVHRPLGATRRLEGLVGAVQSVDSVECATDLEALILEDREIRRLQPRFNTVRQQRTPRLWIRLPPTPHDPKRVHAPPRLELSLGPDRAEGEFVGPFRNESLATHARLLARRIFALDTLRHGNPVEYAAQLVVAWEFLSGQVDTAMAFARRGPARLLRSVLDFDLASALLPADPRLARYAVLRPTPAGIEGFLLDRGILRCWVPPRVVVDDSWLAAELLANVAPRTTPEDLDVVLRWFGAQRPPAALVHLPDEPLAATTAIEAAALTLRDGLA